MDTISRSRTQVPGEVSEVSSSLQDSRLRLTKSMVSDFHPLFTRASSHANKDTSTFVVLIPDSSEMCIPQYHLVLEPQPFLPSY